MFAAVAALSVAALAGSALAVPLSKRDYTNAKFTWYDPDVGIGACGGYNSDSDYVRSGACMKYSGSF